MIFFWPMYLMLAYPVKNRMMKLSDPMMVDSPNELPLLKVLKKPNTINRRECSSGKKSGFTLSGRYENVLNITAFRY